MVASFCAVLTRYDELIAYVLIFYSPPLYVFFKVTLNTIKVISMDVVNLRKLAKQYHLKTLSKCNVFFFLIVQTAA